MGGYVGSGPQLDRPTRTARIIDGRGRGGSRPRKQGFIEEDRTSSRSLPRAYHLTNPDFWLSGVSSTFHGRDMFPRSPRTWRAALTRPHGRFPSLFRAWLPSHQWPGVSGTGHDTAVTGQVIHVDRFGNIITNLPDRLLGPLLEDATSAPVVEIAGHHIFGLAGSYADVREGQPLALMGSEGLLEIAMRNSNAAQRMKSPHRRPGAPHREQAGRRVAFAGVLSYEF